MWTRERDFRGSLSPRIKLCVKTDCSGWRPAARTRGDWCIFRCPAPPPRAAVFSYRSGGLVWRSCRWMILAGGWSLPGPQVRPVTSGAPTKARPPTLRPTPAAAMWFSLCFYGNSGPWRFLQITLWTPAILEATPHLTPTLQRSKQLWEDWPEHPPADTFLLALGFSRYLRSVRSVATGP